MERIEALIAKLKEQYQQKLPASQLLVTVQLLQNELMNQQQGGRTLGTSKVAVVMPSGKVDTGYLHKYAPRPEQQPAETIAAPALPVVQENGQLDMSFDSLLEIPTLSQQVKPAEEKKSYVEGESLNDKLKQDKSELMHMLKDSPVKDLRKAIGINDRFLFINDLFRGDEAMYERSIKTINSFNIFAEAEYWISRELKVKLGWNPDTEAVLQFDQLVKRRFS